MLTSFQNLKSYLMEELIFPRFNINFGVENEVAVRFGFRNQMLCPLSVNRLALLKDSESWCPKNGEQRMYYALRSDIVWVCLEAVD